MKHERDQLQKKYQEMAPETLSMLKISNDLVTLEAIEKISNVVQAYRDFFYQGMMSLGNLEQDINNFKKLATQVKNLLVSLTELTPMQKREELSLLTKQQGLKSMHLEKRTPNAVDSTILEEEADTRHGLLKLLRAEEIQCVHNLKSIIEV